MSPTIAIVDDSPDNRLLRRAFLGDDYELTEYDDGIAARGGLRGSDAQGSQSENCVKAIKSAVIPAVLPGPDMDEPVRALKGKKVLVVDDDMDARILFTNLLQKASCDVVSAGTGKHALQMAREWHPDIITLDYFMPRMNGWAVLHELKADPILCNTPVVVISIAAEENRSALVGAVDFLSKPVGPQELFSVLARHIGNVGTAP
jgi:CheY-like chemotaxis protein